jgi:hypothetical protein
LPWNYGYFKDKDSGIIFKGSKFLKWPKPNETYFNEELFKTVKNKTKPLAMMASNCGAVSRMEIINSLKNYISVDFYGRCGNLRYFLRPIFKPLFIIRNYDH